MMSFCKLTHSVTFCLMFMVISNVQAQPDLPFVNWENHPVNGLDLSPNRNLLAVAHTSDNRVQLFHVSFDTVRSFGHVKVGLDPVSVRFRNNDEVWVVNHISDSISVVSLSDRQVTETIQTCDEPSDVIFAQNKAFICCSQANQVMVVDVNNPTINPTFIPINAEEPKAMAVSADGSKVYVAIFESGNGTTILGGGILTEDQSNSGVLAFPPNVVNNNSSPYNGQNPPPNDGQGFNPPLNPALPDPPAVGMIVRKDEQGAWRDDNGQDWSQQVSGIFANASGRIPGWDLPDRDIAVINTSDNSVRYISRLMNIGMDIAVHPVSGQVTLIGTDSRNEVRFEPVVNGFFATVLMARVSDASPTDKSVLNINQYDIDFNQNPVSQVALDRAIGDPRDIVWSANGEFAYVAGMGSNNVVVIDQQGLRHSGAGLPSEIAVGEGPTDLALNEANNSLYVWNHFEASLSVINTQSRTEVDRVSVFNPLPAAIRDGRKFLYDTNETSGSGFVACASCHVDARFDRLAWDLGDPSGSMKIFNQNCTTDVDSDICEDYHPMKGPMTTQTMIDIIGKEPLHWRGDRDGIEEFNGAFESLLGDDEQLTEAQMQQFKNYLSTLTFAPNPNRNFDNTLPQSLDLQGHFTTGRFAPAGQPLGSGDALSGLDLYNTALLDSPFHCANCHTLPTGMAVNGPLLLGNLSAEAGGEIMPLGPMGENHLGVVSVDGSTNVSIKVPHLRNMHEKVGFELTQMENNAGFGFLHDGSVDSLARFVSEPAFDVNSDQDVADLVALMLSFSGSDFPADNTLLGNTPPTSQDTHAAVGAQLMLDGTTPVSRFTEMQQLAQSGEVDLTASQGRTNWLYSSSQRVFLDQSGNSVTDEQLNALASVEQAIVLTVVPAGYASRVAHDRDGDGISDVMELSIGSNPSDGNSSSLKPVQGLWFNPARSGHGLDIQLLDTSLIVTWYTYNDDGSPTWYQAIGPYSQDWSQQMYTATWNPATTSAVIEVVGTMSLNFTDSSQVQFSWDISGQTGNEPFQYFKFREGLTVQDYTGIWYDDREPGWGLSINSQGTVATADSDSVRVAVLYFYDANNQPRWLLGQSDNGISGPLDLRSFTGFCPGCDYVQPSSVEAGSLEFAFSSLVQSSLTSNANYPELANSTWLRQNTPIIPLSSRYHDPASQ